MEHGLMVEGGGEISSPVFQERMRLYRRRVAHRLRLKKRDPTRGQKQPLQDIENSWGSEVLEWRETGLLKG